MRINGRPEKDWRINMMPVGDGSFYLYMHGDIRKASGTAVGDRVRVEIEFVIGYKKRPSTPHAQLVQTGARRESASHEELDRADPEPQKGDTSLLLAPRFGGRSCPEPG